MATGYIDHDAPGGYGLGLEYGRALPNNSSNVADYDLALESGFYVGYASAAHRPADRIFAVLVLSGSNLVKAQLAISYNSSDIYYRRYQNSTWQNWALLGNQSVFGDNNVNYAGFVSVPIDLSTEGDSYYDIPAADIPEADTGYTLMNGPIISVPTYRVLVYGVSATRVYYSVKSPTNTTTTVTLHYLMRRQT